MYLVIKLLGLIDHVRIILMPTSHIFLFRWINYLNKNFVLMGYKLGYIVLHNLAS